MWNYFKVFMGSIFGLGGIVALIQNILAGELFRNGFAYSLGECTAYLLGFAICFFLIRNGLKGIKAKRIGIK